MDTKGDPLEPPEFGTPDEDMPELTAERAKSLRPVQELFAKHGRAMPAPPNDATVTVQLDRDVVEHFKRQGEGWQALLNTALRDLMRAGR